jgi:hypothetical protein
VSEKGFVPVLSMSSDFHFSKCVTYKYKVQDLAPLLGYVERAVLVYFMSRSSSIYVAILISSLKFFIFWGFFHANFGLLLTRSYTITVTALLNENADEKKLRQSVPVDASYSFYKLTPIYKNIFYNQGLF